MARLRYSPTETTGVNAVERVINDEFGWIFRPLTTHDFGLDAEIELTDDKGIVTGLICKVQVKSGPSYFKDGNADAVYFYIDDPTMSYWEGHSLPVILTLHDPAAKATYWVLVSKATARKTPGNWRIDVPRRQILSLASKPQLEAILKAGKGRALSPVPGPLPAQGQDTTPWVDAVRSGPDEPETEQLPRVRAGPSGSTPQAALPTLSDAAMDAALAAMSVAQLLSLAKAQLTQTGLAASPEQATEDPALHARIDAWRSFIETNPLQARQQYVTLLDTIDRGATPHAFFRALSNRAACDFALGRVADAGKTWEEAYNLEPTNPAAIANLALARLLGGKVSEATAMARTALAIKADDKTAVSVLLQALARDPSWSGDPEALIPASIRETPDVAIALVEFLRRRDDPAWREAAREAADRFPTEIIFQTTAAHAVLDLASPFSEPSKPLSRRVERADLEAAARVLAERAEAWLAQDYADDAELETYVNNAAVAYRLLGQPSVARTLIDRALAARPNLIRLFKLRGVLLTLEGDPDGALADLARAPSDDGEAQLFLAELLGENDPGEALKVARAVPDADIPEHLRSMRWLIMASAALRLRDRAALDEALTQVRRDEERGLFAEVFELAWAVKEGLDETDAQNQMRDIAAKMAPDAPLSLRFSMADALRRYKLWFEASETLDGYVNLEQADEMTLLFIAMLASARRDQRFLSMLAEASPSVREHPDVLRTTAIHAYNAGDLPRAESAAGRLVKALPDKLDPVLLLLNILARQDKRARIRRILKNDIEALSVDGLDDQLKLARYLFAFGDELAALRYTYRLSWNQRDDRRALMAQAMQTLEATRRPNDLLGEAETVAQDTAVTFEAEGRTQVFIVEPDPELRQLSDKAWPPDHPTVVAAWGLAEGAGFTLPGGESAKITQITHKYVWRAREAMEVLPARFPNNPGFQRFKVDPDVEGGFDSVIAVAKAQREANDAILEEYKAGRATLAMLALQLGSSSIDLAESLPAAGYRLVNALGGVEDRQEATAALMASPQAAGFVIDAVTFWTTWRLRALETLVDLLGPIHVATTVFDELSSRREFLEPHVREGLKQLGYRDGHPTLTETSAEVIQSAIAELDSAIAWLRENATIQPAHIPVELPGDLARNVGQLQFHFLDEVFIALNEGLLLLSDDQRLRKLAQELGVKRFAWTQWALAWAVDSKKATTAQYIEWSVKLVDSGHSYIAVTPDVLLEAVELDLADGRLRARNGRYRSLVRALGGADAEPISHLRVMSLVIKQLWRRTNLLQAREFATGVILERLAVERPDGPVLFNVLSGVFAGNADVQTYMLGWLRGHFLMPFQPAEAD